MAIAIPAIIKGSSIIGDILEDQEKIIGLVLSAMVAILSTPIAAFMINIVVVIQWQMEHISVTWDKYAEGTNKFSIKRLSTMDTSDIANPNTTPLSPPLLSTAVRLADAGADTAEAGAKLAQSYIGIMQTAVNAFQAWFTGLLTP